MAGARPASAHAIVVDSQPPTGATVAPGPVNVVIRYNSRIDFARSRLSLVSNVDAQGKGQETTLSIREDNSPAVIGATTAALSPGSYRLRWQVLAVDGHITRGDILFTVADAGARGGTQGTTSQGASSLGTASDGRASPVATQPAH